MNITRTNMTVKDDAFFKTRTYMDVKSQLNSSTSFKGWSVTEEESTIIHGFLEVHKDGEQAVSTLLMKNIQISVKNLEAVHSVLQGTTPKDARAISKILRSSKDDHLKDTIKGFMAESLAVSTMSLLRQHQTVTESKIYNYTANTIEKYSKNGRYQKKVYSEFTQYKQTRTGHFVDETIQSEIDSYLEGKDSKKLKEVLTKRFKEKFDDLMKSLDSYDFEVLVHETIMLSDNELSKEEIRQLSGLPYKLQESQESYQILITNIKSWTETGTRVISLESIAEKLHDALLSEDFTDYLEDDALKELVDIKHEVDQLLSHGNITMYENFKCRVKNLEVTELSKTRLINTVFNNPYIGISQGLRYTSRAKRMLKLVEYADIHVAFDKVYSEPVLVWNNTQKANRPIIQSKFKSSTQIMTKKRCGRDLLNNATSQAGVREYFMSMLGYESQVLDIRFLQYDRLLDFSNFYLAVGVHYKEYGLANYQINVQDYHMSFSVSSTSMRLLEVVKHQETYITESVNTMGFKGVTYSYQHTNHIARYMDSDGDSHHIHAEASHQVYSEISL